MDYISIQMWLQTKNGVRERKALRLITHDPSSAFASHAAFSNAKWNTLEDSDFVCLGVGVFVVYLCF